MKFLSFCEVDNFLLLYVNIYLVFLYFICSYALFDMDGNQVPQDLVTKVGEAFESILKEVCNLFGLTMSIIIFPLVYWTIDL